MSDLLPTKEQEEAAKAYIDRCFGDGPCGMAEDLALLLVERDEARETVIRRFRSVVHQLLTIDESEYPIMDRILRDDARQAMLESAQYEVNE